MLQIVLPYTGWERDIDFLITKQHIIHLDYYRLSFYLHIFSSLIIILSGFVLFSSKILKNQASLHRIVGKLYVGLVLLISAPSGLIMAFHANGNLATKISFILLTILWWLFTYKGYSTIRKGDIKAHKNWMYRSYALTMSAITLRLAQMILNSFWELDPELQYCFISWGSWIVNLLFVELFLIKKFKSHTPKINTITSYLYNSKSFDRS